MQQKIDFTKKSFVLKGWKHTKHDCGCNMKAGYLANYVGKDKKKVYKHKIVIYNKSNGKVLANKYFHKKPTKYELVKLKNTI